MGVKDDIKRIFREVLIKIGWDLTLNIRNDRLAKKVLIKVLSRDSNCIDVGAHKGDFTQWFLRLAPYGNHLAIEPIESLARQLEKQFGNRVGVVSCAVGKERGQATFQLLEKDMAYSGLQKRSYPSVSEQPIPITVSVSTLDELVKDYSKIDFIKLDIEGGEYNALLGAHETLEKYHPILLFEFGKGAAEYYNATPQKLYAYLVTKHSYQLFTLEDFIKERQALSFEKFENCYVTNSEYYFVAAK